MIVLIHLSIYAIGSFACLCFYLSVFVYQSVKSSFRSYWHYYTHLIYLATCLSVSVYQSVKSTLKSCYNSTNIPIHLSVYLSAFLSVYLFICQNSFQILLTILEPSLW